MSSLVTYASPWNNDTDNCSNKKRMPTMRKTIKNRPLNDADEYTTYSENFQNSQPSSVSDMQNESENRSERVTELLNKITSADTSNDGKKLGNFQPIEPPSLHVKKDDLNTLSMLPPFNQKNGDVNGTSEKDSKPKYAAVSGSGDKYGNYMKSYEGTPLPYYSKMGVGSGQGSSVGLGMNDDKLMQKINYMVHLLENQQNEKTDNITEEFILYTFLGVFIIFIVDSFARTGKYTR